MKQTDYIRTSAADQAVEMCKAVLAARSHCRIGQITGQPGTGKSALTCLLADEMGALRIECWTRISDKDLLRLIVEAAIAAGIAIDPNGTGNTLFKRLIAVLEGRLDGSVTYVRFYDRGPGGPGAVTLDFAKL